MVSVRPPGPERARYPPPDHRPGNGGGPLVPLRRPPFPAGGRTCPRRRHGGGSLELIGAVDNLVELSVSLPLGAVRLTELHLPGSGPPERGGGASRIRAEATQAANLGSPMGRGHDHWKRRNVHEPRPNGPLATGASPGDWFTASPSLPPRWSSSSTSWQAARRNNAAGAGLKERADIILAGLAVTAELLDRVRARSITVERVGLREGLLLEMSGAKSGHARSVATLPRVRRALPVRSKHVEQVRTWRSSSSTSSAKSSAAVPRSACCSRRPDYCTTSASS